MKSFIRLILAAVFIAVSLVSAKADLWKGDLWEGSVYHGDVWESGFDLSPFYFIIDDDFQDLVEPLAITVDAEAGRPNGDDGTFAGEDEFAQSSDGQAHFYPAYVQLIKKSRDISNGVWTKSAGVTITGTDVFQVDSINDFVRQVMVTTDSLLYTFSFIASVESGGQTTGYKILHDNSASGNVTALVLTEIPTLYKVTILGRSGGGNTFFGIRDDNTSNWAEVTITDFQVTETPSRLPYAPNDSAVATLSIPANNSTATSPSIGWTITEGLRNALDGLPDGVEKVVGDDSDMDTVGNWESGGAATVTGGYDSGDAGHSKTLRVESGDATSDRAELPVSAFGGITTGKNYVVSFDYKWISVTSGGTLISLGGAASLPAMGKEIVWTNYIGRVITVDNTSPLRIYSTLSGAATDELLIDNASVQAISLARAEWQMTGVFHFNAADTSGTINILTANGETATYINYDIDDEQFELNDGTNEAVVTYTAIDGTPWDLSMMIGDDSGQKMSLNVDATEGSKVTNAGSLPNANKLDIGFETTEWFSLEPNIKVYDEVKSW